MEIETETELFDCGHLACAGCGASLAMKYILEGLGKDTIVVITASCWSVIPGPFPQTALNIPVFHTAFGTAASVASGVRASLDITGKGYVNVLAWAGDGGTFDIGIQSLSGAAERNENIIYVCYDNEAYMNTGIQRSSATPWGAWTTTTPVAHPKSRPKKNIIEILAAHNISYATTASIAFPEDIKAKISKIKGIYGMKFIHILSPCPPGWKSNTEHTVKLARLAVETRIFPLYEVFKGNRYILNYEPKGANNVLEYLRLQGRFKHLLERDIEHIQREIENTWNSLLKKTTKG